MLLRVLPVGLSDQNKLISEFGWSFKSDLNILMIINIKMRTFVFSLTSLLRRTNTNINTRVGREVERRGGCGVGDWGSTQSF
jgi:hypothetical protein